jgi:two-component system, sensor histidine kinase
MSGPLTRFGIDSESREQRQEKILAGVIATVYRQVPQSVLGSIVLGFALVAAFWNTHDQNALIAWFIAMLVESLIRLRVARAFADSTQTVEKVHNWATWWVALAASAGLLWGAAGCCSSSRRAAEAAGAGRRDPRRRLRLADAVCDPPAGAVRLPAGRAAAADRAHDCSSRNPAYVTAAIVMLAVFGFTMFFGRSFGATMFESVKNNYENEVLVGQLLNEKRVADEARRAAEEATRSKTSSSPPPATTCASRCRPSASTARC